MSDHRVLDKTIVATLTRAARPWILGVVVAVAAVLALRPLLSIGFIDDELPNSYADGWIGWHHMNLWSYYLLVVNLWIKTQGRFMPLNLGSVDLLYHFTHSALIVKSTQVALIGLNAATFFMVAARLSRSPWFGVLAASCVSLTLEIRFLLDPIAGFAPLMPLVTEFMLLALWGQLEYHRTDRSRYLVAAVLSYVCAALTYEITYAYIIILIGLAWYRPSRKRRAFVETCAFCLPVVLLVLLSLALRAQARVPAGSPYAISLTIAPYIRTFWYQFSSALPLSIVQLWSGGAASISRVFILSSVTGTFVSVTIGLIAALAASKQAKRTDSESTEQIDLWCPSVVGILLWLLAVPMIALSPRWQAELVMGQAYLPVYFEYFGVALLLAVVSASLYRTFPTRFTVVTIGVVIGLATFCTYQSNRLALEAYQKVWTQGRLALEDAARLGLFHSVPDGATVILDNSYIWLTTTEEPGPNSKYLLFQLTGKRYKILLSSLALPMLCSSQAIARHSTCALSDQGIFNYSSDTPTLNPGERWTRVSRIPLYALDANGAYGPYVDEEDIEAVGPPTDRLSGLSSKGVAVNGNGAGNPVVASVQSCLALPLAIPPSANRAELSSDVYGAEHDIHGDFHWSRRHSFMFFTSGPRRTRVRVSFGLSSYVPGSLIAVTFSHHVSRIKASILGVPVQYSFTLQPASRARLDLQLIGKSFVSQTDPRDLAFRIVGLRVESDCD